jgi:hypothetical protein
MIESSFITLLVINNKERCKEIQNVLTRFILLDVSIKYLKNIYININNINMFTKSNKLTKITNTDNSLLLTSTNKLLTNISYTYIFYNELFLSLI